MAQEHSFDIVSKVNLQEMRNGVQMAQKEIATRFDFRGSSASVDFEEAQGLLKLTADHAAQLNSVKEVVEGKLAKRGIALQALDWQSPEQLPSGGMKRQAKLQQGIAGDKAKQAVKVIKDLGLKIQPRIEGETVRVSGKQLDDLQNVIAALKRQDFGIPLQMENYR